MSSSGVPLCLPKGMAVSSARGASEVMSGVAVRISDLPSASCRSSKVSLRTLPVVMAESRPAHSQRMLKLHGVEPITAEAVRVKSGTLCLLCLLAERCTVGCVGASVELAKPPDVAAVGDVARESEGETT